MATVEPTLESSEGKLEVPASVEMVRHSKSARTEATGTGWIASEVAIKLARFSLIIVLV